MFCNICHVMPCDGRVTVMPCTHFHYMLLPAMVLHFIPLHCIDSITCAITCHSINGHMLFLAYVMPCAEKNNGHIITHCYIIV
jgi:hypothetical protein